MTEPELDPATLRKLRLTIALALSSLVAVSLAVAFADLWPAAWIDGIATSLFGHSAWKLRVLGTFCLFAAALMSALLVAVFVTSMWRRLQALRDR